MLEVKIYDVKQNIFQKIIRGIKNVVPNIKQSKYSNQAKVKQF